MPMDPLGSAHLSRHNMLYSIKMAAHSLRALQCNIHRLHSTGVHGQSADMRTSGISHMSHTVFRNRTADACCWHSLRFVVVCKKACLRMACITKRISRNPDDLIGTASMQSMPTHACYPIECPRLACWQRGCRRTRQSELLPGWLCAWSVISAKRGSER